MLLLTFAALQILCNILVGSLMRTNPKTSSFLTTVWEQSIPYDHTKRGPTLYDLYEMRTHTYFLGVFPAVGKI